MFGRPHVRPDQATAFPGGIGCDRYLGLEQRIRRLRRHVEALAIAPELPAVIDAAHPTLLVAREEHRRATMRTKRVHQTDLAVCLPERDEVFAQDAHSDGWAVGLGKLA